MSSTDEMKRILRHLNEKIGTSLRYELSVSAGWRHVETITTLAYAQGVLDLLVTYLRGDDESGQTEAVVAEDVDDDLDDMPTDAELDAEAGEES